MGCKCGSQVILCNLPIRFDTYKGCSHGCRYCFAQKKNDISHIERGKKIMSMETLVSLANALQVSTDELLADSLEYPPAAFHHAFAPVVADCSAYERQFLLRVISEIKRALREGTAG